MARIFGSRLTGTALALVLGAALLAPAETASAGGRNHYYNGGDLLAAGVFGAVIGSLIAPPPVYAAPPPVYVYPEPVYVYPEPVYVNPAPVPYYSAPAYGRRSLDQMSGTYYPQPVPGRTPNVVTYDNAVGTGVARTPEWLAYCRSKFRSFDERSGTYLGYDGQRHICVMR